MAQQKDVRSHELIARDLADRLLPDCTASEFLVWVPNLFAYTSYVLSLTGAYQLVISPPTDCKWFPEIDDIKEWLEPDKAKKNIETWLKHKFSNVKASQRSSRGRSNKTKVDPTLARLVDELSPKQDVTRKRSQLFTKWKKRNGIGSGKIADAGKIVGKDGHGFIFWRELVDSIGENWQKSVDAFPGAALLDVEKGCDRSKSSSRNLFNEYIRKHVPKEVVALWAYFYVHCFIEGPEWWINEEKRRKGNGHILPIQYLLCNQISIGSGYDIKKLWWVTQALLTLHAICDETAVGWGLAKSNPDSQNFTTTDIKSIKGSQGLCEQLLMTNGTMSTFKPQRCRVMPKRHNPNLGITLRSLSSNLAFQISSVDVVWRRSAENDLTRKLVLPNTDPSTPKEHKPLSDEKNTATENLISILLLPLPREVHAKAFSASKNNEDRVELVPGHKFFVYEANKSVRIDDVKEIVEHANKELTGGNHVDIVVLPECAITPDDIEELEAGLKSLKTKTPAIYIAGVSGEKQRSAKASTLSRFQVNSVHCKYLEEVRSETGTTEDEGKKNDGSQVIDRSYGSDDLFAKTWKANNVPKYIQYKHHRWRIDDPQIRQYGLSCISKDLI
jgi:hypothetical protein